MLLACSSRKPSRDRQGAVAGIIGNAPVWFRPSCPDAEQPLSRLAELERNRNIENAPATAPLRSRLGLALSVRLEIARDSLDPTIHFSRSRISTAGCCAFAPFSSAT